MKKIMWSSAVTFACLVMTAGLPAGQIVFMDAPIAAISVSPTSTKTRVKGKDAIYYFERLKKAAKLPQLDRSLSHRLFAADNYTIIPGESREIKTDLKIQIPEGHLGLIYSEKTGQLFQVLDSSYQGAVEFWYQNLTLDIHRVDPGELVAHLAIIQLSEINISNLQNRG